MPRRVGISTESSPAAGPAELVLGAHGREAYALGFQAADFAYFLEIIRRSKSTYGGGVESDGSRLVQFMRAATGGSADDSITIAEKVQMPGLQPPAHWTGRPGIPPQHLPGRLPRGEEVH